MITSEEPPREDKVDSTTVEQNKATVVAPTIALAPVTHNARAGKIRQRKGSTSQSSVKKDASLIEAEVLTPDAIAKLKTLSDEERSDKQRLEHIVRHGIEKSFIASEALREIRERQLWRETHESFKAYCDDVLDTSEQRVSQMLLFADEVAYLKDRKVPDSMIPESERAIRELRRAKKANRVAVLEIAFKLSDGKRPTSINIETARLTLEGSATEEEKDSVIKTKSALDAAQKVKAFIHDCDVKALTVGQIDDLKKVISEIVADARKLELQSA